MSDSLPASTEQTSGPVAAVPSTAEAGPSTLPLVAADEATTRHMTTPLHDPGGPPSPPLEEGALAAGRYQVVSLLGSGDNSNLYRVLDTQGYRRCWACGSPGALEGDVYCVECGAQLTDRHYRMREFSTLGPDANGPNRLPAAILANSVQGVAHVHDALEDTEAERAYVVWEEVHGRSLASYLQNEDGAPPNRDIVALSTGWLVQAAELLANLHAQGITDCEIGPENLVVEPGDRLLLVDAGGCVQNYNAGKDETAPLQAAGVQRLAQRLAEWHSALTTANRAPQVAGAAAAEVEAPAGEQAGPATVTATLQSGEDAAAGLLSTAAHGAFPTAQEFAAALRELFEAGRPPSRILTRTGRASNLGQVRQINEDSLLTLEANVMEHEEGLPLGLYVIADGMGGHQSGEVASAIAARTVGAVANSSLIAPMLAGDAVPVDIDTCAGILRHGIIEANKRITDLANERRSDLGTTTVAALVVGNQVCVANIGDSRAYLWHDGELSPITRDHSLVAQLVAAGQITPDEVYTHPRRNEIFRALGETRLVPDDIDIFGLRLQPGDGLLLCSDGLWDFVRDPAIARTIEQHNPDDPQAVCDALVNQANEAGGEDNISVIFLRGYSV